MNEQFRQSFYGRKPQMFWKRLLENRCPKAECGKDLEYIEPSVGATAYAKPKFICSNMNCDYVIMKDRFEELCMKMQNERLERDAQ